MILLRKDSIIYILAPYNSASGGPEALHQLCYYFTGLNYQARIAYYYFPDKTSSPTPERYRQYGVSYCYLDEIPDEEHHLLICPESTTHLLSGFSRIRKAVWWLSVDFYRFNSGGHLLLKIIRHLAGLRFAQARQAIELRRKLVSFADNSITHFTGSHYAFDFVKAKGAQNVQLLIEPLGLDFLRSVVHANYLPNTSMERDNAVLYNPAKAGRTMKRLMARYPNRDYVPLQGMTADDLIQRMKGARVYMDLGYFPGPERLPKEAVVCGCCILTSRRGAAAYYGDVRIPEEFKCADNDIEVINDRLSLLLDDYRNQYGKFDEYRNMVFDLEENLKKQIRELFVITSA